jgi:hypothetical protein
MTWSSGIESGGDSIGEAQSSTFQGEIQGLTLIGCA